MYSFPKPNEWSTLPLYTKIQIYKTHLDERFSKFVDKLEAKKIVKEICGNTDKIHVANIVRILESPDDLKEDDLQNTNCLLKATHGSGWNIQITEKTKLEFVKQKLHKWNTPYIGSDEKHYQYVKPGFFFEECIEDAYGGEKGKAVVFMFRCIQGNAVTIGVKKGGEQNMYLITGECLGKSFPFVLPMHKINEMKELAEKLSNPFEFVRIDFYLGVKGEIYFSEYTFTPAGGQPIYSEAIEKYLGSLWT